MLGYEVGGTAFAMAHHEHVYMHRLQVAQGVEQGFSLGCGRGADVQVENIGGEAFCCYFEGGPGAGAGFEK